MDEAEELGLRIPAPQPLEERVPTGVVQTAILYKLLKEARETKAALEAVADRLLAIKEAVTARGEVLPMKRVVEGEGWVKVEPGFGMWRGVNIYNEGPGSCVVKLNRLDAVPVAVEANGSKSWTFMTEAVRAIYVRCEPSGRAVLEFEFLR